MCSKEPNLGPISPLHLKFVDLFRFWQQMLDFAATSSDNFLSNNTGREPEIRMEKGEAY